MNIARIVASLLASLLTLVLSSHAYAGEGNNSIKFTAGFNPVGTIFLVDYERLIADKFSVGGRVGAIDYTVEDGSYTEDGNGNGIEATFRWYPRGEGFKGFFLGAGLGYWDTDWSWTDPYDTPNKGSGSSAAVDVNFNVGWKIAFGRAPVYFEPSIIVGDFLSVTTQSDTSTSGNESELGVYALVALAIGFAF
jgi:hypothetical protein